MSKQRNRLTEEQIQQVRELYATGEWPQKQLAEKAGVSKDTIGKYVKGVEKRKTMKNMYIHHAHGTTSIYIESLDRILEMCISTEDFLILENRGYNICIQYNKGSRTFYARSNGKYVHRLLKGEPEGMEVHHIDGSGLNNIRENLEVLTSSEHRHKKRSKEPIVGDPSKGVKVHLLTKAEKNKKLQDRYFWFRLEVNGVHYGTFDCDVKLNLHAKIADMVVNGKCTDEQVYDVFLPRGRNEQHVTAVIKEVRIFFRTPNPSKKKKKALKKAVALKN